MTLPQRRRWERYRKELAVTVKRGDGGEPITAATLDVCEGGIGLLCPQSLDGGQEYEIAAADLSAAPLIGVVRWSTRVQSRDVYHIGVELTNLSAAQAEEIRSAIEGWKAANTASADA